MTIFADLNRTQLKALAPDALVVLPLGATEQHGPHLACGMDYYTVETVAREAASRVEEEIPIVVAPALPYGSSDHHLVFGATLSLSTETYYRVLRELLQSLVVDGFTRIFLVNGHGGNHELAELAARDVALKSPVRVAACSYWVLAWEALIARNAHKGRRLPGHAGDFETSLMLSLRPELVSSDLPVRLEVKDTDPGAFQPPYRVERNGSWQEIDGYTDSPAAANAEKGRLYRETMLTALATAFIEFYRG